MDNDLKIVIEIIKKAWSILMKYYGSSNLNTKFKVDEFDPVTQADFESEKYILEEIKKHFPDDKILSEETENTLRDFSWRVRMIDPLDWTKDFVWWWDMSSVMIGLCVDGIPELGVVFAPIRNSLYYAQKGQWAYYISHHTTAQKIHVSNTNSIHEVTYFSKSKFSEKREINEKIEEVFSFKNILDWGSVWTILWEIARWKAECYILTNNKWSKWDICAPQIILEEAWGTVTDAFWEKINFLSEWIKLDTCVVATNGLIHNEIIKKTKVIF